MNAIDKVRKVANLVEIASEHTKLKKRGNKLVGNCPFCKEKDKFTVDAVRALYHCYSCGVGGDVFTFVMEVSKVSFPEALKCLQGRYGMELDSLNIEYDNLVRCMQRVGGDFRRDFDKWMSEEMKDKVFIHLTTRLIDWLEKKGDDSEIPF